MLRLDKSLCLSIKMLARRKKPKKFIRVSAFRFQLDRHSQPDARNLKPETRGSASNCRTLIAHLKIEFSATLG
jgi:hypothetical protein